MHTSCPRFNKRKRILHSRSVKNATLSNLTHGYPTTSRSHNQPDNDGDHDSDEGDNGGGGRVAPVIKVAEAPRRVVVVGALRVELLETEIEINELSYQSTQHA